MSGKILLDTSIAVAILRGRPTALAATLEVQSSLLPIVALGELTYGLRRSGNRRGDDRKLAALLDRVDVVPITLTTCERYASVRHDLKRQGMPIPENDVWIAATAIEHDLMLATLDHHFQRVGGLRLCVP
ncbi:MAG: PIN domain-containing protein [Phycisphaeraceae bacterium]